MTLHRWQIVEGWAASLPTDRFEYTRHDLARYAGWTPQQATQALQEHKYHTKDREHTLERKGKARNARWGRLSGERRQNKRLAKRTVAENIERVIVDILCRAEPSVAHNPGQMHRVRAFGTCIGQQAQAILTLADSVL